MAAMRGIAVEANHQSLWKGSTGFRFACVYIPTEVLRRPQA